MKIPSTRRPYTFIFLLLLATIIQGSSQVNIDKEVSERLPEVLKKHRNFVSIPNVSAVPKDMYKNIEFVQPEFENLGFKVSLLESNTLPVFFAEKNVEATKTILFYFHLDGQPAQAENWDQRDPFIPVLKSKDIKGNFKSIPWNYLDKEIDPEWRIFGRAAADDKGPIMMMLTALEMLQDDGKEVPYNMKVILDLQEEAGSDAFLSTLEEYKEVYAADYLIIMDGPAHNSNKPTLTFGCRGIATCSITTFGAKLPQHSGHYGNYAPNPVFGLSHILSSMKSEDGRVTIDGYYDKITLAEEVKEVLQNVPDDNTKITKDLKIFSPDKVAEGYQESLQYPSLNVRQIETSYKGPGLKTVIPEYATAHIDARLVLETDGKEHLDLIKKHIEAQGFLVLDRDPSDEERLSNRKIVKFTSDRYVNAFRTDMNAELGRKLSDAISNTMGENPVKIRTMGGTVPIIPAVNTLGIPAVIVPMVNMDNNQHNPNENLRIGNMIDGIKICYGILQMEL